MRRYGAHSIGIGWKRRAGNKTAEPCLTFYVSHKHERAENPVPKSFSFLPEGKSRRVTLPTDVVEIPKPLARISHSESRKGDFSRFSTLV